MRASVAAEAMGIPSASIVSTTFVRQAKAIAKALISDELPVLEYPGVIMTDSDETLREKVRTGIVDRVVAAFTEPRG